MHEVRKGVERKQTNDQRRKLLHLPALHQQGKEDHMHYYICEICGANLDPGEKCECQEIEKAATTKNEEKHGKTKPTRLTI